MPQPGPTDVGVHACLRLVELRAALRSGSGCVGPLDDESLFLDAKLHLVTAVEAQQIKQRTIDNEPGAIPYLREPLGTKTTARPTMGTWLRRLETG